jgi:IS1 family transposase
MRHFGEKEGQGMAYICVSPGKREIAAYVWGKPGHKTAETLKERITELGIRHNQTATENRDSFLAVFGGSGHLAGKEYTVGIEGNNCRLRHQIWRVFRRTCYFSKKLYNHLKAFDITVFYMANFNLKCENRRA